MTRKNTIIIFLILFLIIIAALFFLYFGKIFFNNRARQVYQPGNTNSPQTPAQIFDQKINKIIEETKNNPDETRQEVVNAINEEIIKQGQSKTPEQKTAEAKDGAERQKIIDQINNQIRQRQATVK